MDSKMYVKLMNNFPRRKPNTSNVFTLIKYKYAYREQLFW